MERGDRDGRTDRELDETMERERERESLFHACYNSST